MASDESVARAKTLITAVLFGACVILCSSPPARAEEPTAKEHWTEDGDLVVPFGSVTFQVPAKYVHARGFGYMPGSMKFYFNWPSFTPLPTPTKGDAINQVIMIIVYSGGRNTQERNDYAKKLGETLEYDIPDNFTGIASGDEYSFVNGSKFRLSDHFYMKYVSGAPVGHIHCGKRFSCIGYFDYADSTAFSIGFTIQDVGDIPPIEEAVRRFLDSMRKQEG